MNNENKPIAVKISLTKEEWEAFSKKIRETGRAKGPFLSYLIRKWLKGNEE